jgi:hypothetical protein
MASLRRVESKVIGIYSTGLLDNVIKLGVEDRGNEMLSLMVDATVG